MPSDTERSISIGEFRAVTSAMIALERSPLGALGFRAGIPTPLYRLNFGDNHDRLIRVPGALWHVLASLSERRNKLLQWASDICLLLTNITRPFHCPCVQLLGSTQSNSALPFARHAATLRESTAAHPACVCHAACRRPMCSK